MKKRLLAFLGVLLASAGMVLAQSASPGPEGANSAPPPAGAALPILPGANPPVLSAVPSGNGSTPGSVWSSGNPAASGSGQPRPGLWVSGEYLLWWVKSAPLPFPLATVGDPGAAAASGLPLGGLNTPGTVVISPTQQNFGALGGGRVSLGWRDCEGNLGAEASGFLMEQRSSSFARFSGAGGNPAIGVPFLDPVAGLENAVGLSAPGVAQGGVVISSTVGLWGAEANGLLGFFRGDYFTMDLLGGFRYLDLAEHLEIESFSSAPVLATTGPLPAAIFQDHFATRNQLYSLQAGAKAGVHFDRFFLDLTCKVALGNSYETLVINGNILLPAGVVPPPGFSSLMGGGIFAQATNIGRWNRHQWVVAPEARLQAGFDITRHLRAFAGYDFLFLDKVARPGRQMDHFVDLTQSVFFSAPAPVSTTSTNPAQMFNTTNFWAQGISVGLQLSF